MQLRVEHLRAVLHLAPSPDLDHRWRRADAVVLAVLVRQQERRVGELLVVVRPNPSERREIKPIRQQVT